MRDKDESYDRLIREYNEVQTDIVVSDAELKKIGKDFIEFGKDLINRREALSFDKENIDLDASKVMGLIEKHDRLIGRRHDIEKRLAEFGPLPKL